ncbi:MAG TPA: DUF1439 domain-containing protein [Burkholderiaceae bacterium]
MAIPLPSRGRRRAALFAVLGAAALAATLSGCAGLAGRHEVSLSESQLTLLLAREFPMQRKVLEVIDLQLTDPRIHLLPESNRLGTEFDVEADDRLFGNSAHGHVRVDYGLRFDAADHTIRMTDVRVRQLDVAAGSSNLHGAAQRLGTLAAESLLENQPLYRMKPAQADEMDRLGLVASPIRVGAQGISMTLSPRRD